MVLKSAYYYEFSFQIQVQNPAAKTMLEISRAQDEEVGDGTTSVIILGKIIIIIITLS